MAMFKPLRSAERNYRRLERTT